MGRDLRRHWLAVIESIGGADEPAAHAWDVIARRYDEDHRHYHTLDHVGDVVSAVDALGGGSVEVLAGYLHDVVYDPDSAANEEASAVLGHQLLTPCNVVPDLNDEVGRLIRLTVGHAPERGDDPGAVVCDADLSTLGASPDRYRLYTEQVRAEYAHVPDLLWRSGRIGVLERFLTRDHLFHTSEGRSWWEDQARDNLRGELARLR